MTTPPDGNSMESTSQQNPTISPASPSPPPPPGKKKTSASSMAPLIHGLFLASVILALFGFLIFLDIRFTEEVESRQPIGRLLHMSGPGGVAGDVVIETEQGWYLLHGAPAVSKGTLLILEVRASGTHFICDEARSLCLRSSSKKFFPKDVRPEPSASIPIPIPSPTTTTSSPAEGQTK